LEKSVKIFPTPFLLAENIANNLVRKILDSSERGKTFSIALSGGSTPELLYTLLGDRFSKSIPWQFVHLFWGDERCVPPTNIESNYRMTKSALIDKTDIPASNIHRIRGEEEPGNEAVRYSGEVAGCLDINDGLPLFDMVILGLGEDGHTASIFPGQSDLLYSDKICEVAVHPVTEQRRITLTGRVINNAVAIVFIVTGKNKAVIAGKVIRNSGASSNFPAAHIVPVHGSITWYLDRDAGCLL
jgi:6-phosphogluconolactonase